MQIWTVANQKGGVGKTTTAVAVGGISASTGRRVLLVDLDPHGSLSAYFKIDQDRIEGNAFTIFESKQRLSPSLILNTVCPTPYENIYVLSASMALATLERQGIGNGMGLVLSKALGLIADDFDLCVIDCPPVLGVLMVNALAACQRLLIPVQTEFLALKGLERILHTLEMLGRSRKQPLPRIIIPTMFDRRTQASVGSLRTIRNTWGDSVWAGKIPIDTRLRDASKAGVPPDAYDPSCRGVEAYESLFNHLMREACAPVRKLEA